MGSIVLPAGPLFHLAKRLKLGPSTSAGADPNALGPKLPEHTLSIGGSMSDHKQQLLESTSSP